MKTTKLLTITCLLCTLISCERNLPTPEEYEAVARQLATYLTDNYTIGDSVLFRTETGDIEGFIVDNIMFSEIILLTEPDFDEATGEEIASEKVIEGYKLDLDLLNNQNHIIIRFQIHDDYRNYYERNPGIVSEGSIVIICEPNHVINTTSFVPIDINSNPITISSETMTCVLQKNIGVTKITLNEHVWEFVELLSNKKE